MKSFQTQNVKHYFSKTYHCSQFTHRLRVILLHWDVQYPAAVCGELAVCRVGAGGPDSQLRSEDERETAGEECMFRDGWTQGWKAFSNCANFRPHMSVNLPKPVHSVSPLAPIKPPLCLCVCVCICAYVYFREVPYLP